MIHKIVLEKDSSRSSRGFLACFYCSAPSPSEPYPPPMRRPASTAHAYAHWIARVAKQWRVQNAPATSQGAAANAPRAVDANLTSQTASDTRSGKHGGLNAGLQRQLPRASPWELQNHNTSSNNMRNKATTCRVTQTMLTKMMVTTSLPHKRHLKQRRLGRGAASATSKATARESHCRL